MSTKKSRKSLSSKYLQQKCHEKEAKNEYDVTNPSSTESVNNMSDRQLVVFNTFDKLAQNWRSSIDTSLEELDSSIHESDYEQDADELALALHGRANLKSQYGTPSPQQIPNPHATDEEKWRKISHAHIIPVCKKSARNVASLTECQPRDKNHELSVSYQDCEKERFAHSLEDSAVDVDYDPDRSICDAVNTELIEVNEGQRRYRTQVNVSFVSKINYGHVSSPDLRSSMCVGGSIASYAGDNTFISHSQDSFMVIGRKKLQDTSYIYNSDYRDRNRSSVGLNNPTDGEDTESQVSDDVTDSQATDDAADTDNCLASLTTSDTTNREITAAKASRHRACTTSRNGEIELEREVEHTVEMTVQRRNAEKESVESKTQMIVLRKEIQNKNQEIKELKLQLKFQKEKIRDLTQQLEKGHQNRSMQELASNAQIRQLRDILKSLRLERERLRKELAEKSTADKFEKASLRKAQELERRRQRLKKTDDRVDDVITSKSVQKIQKSLHDREKELNLKQKTIYKLECEKLYLGEEIYRLTGIEEGFWSDEKLPRPTLSPKEQCLVRKNSTLNTEVSRLQKHCKTLVLENDSLKRKMEFELERPLERKEKERDRQKELHKLKKKNNELSTITRKLEEKVKSLEKKTKESPTTNRRTLILNKQKERDAEYERQIHDRDREIQKLKLRMRELVRKLTGQNGEITRAQSTLELEQIIRTVTKERLQLERHLAVTSEGLSRSSDLQTEQATKLASIRDTNSALRQQLDDLELLTRQHHTLEKHVQEKDLECVSLKEKLKLKNELCQDLECQLAKVIEKNTVLTIQNSDLQKQIQELQHVNVSEECRSLKQTLGRLPRDSQWVPNSGVDSRTRPATLDSCNRLDNAYGLPDGTPQCRPGDASLEQVLIQMKEASEKRRELQKQHAEALQQLCEKQAALEGVLGSASNKKAASEAIEALKSKIRELEKKAEVQNLRHEELLLEMQSMKKTQGSPKNSWSRSESLSVELQSPESEDITPDSSQILSNCSTPRSTPVPTGLGIIGGSLQQTFDPLGLGNLPDTLLTNPPLSTSPLTGHADKNLLNGNLPGVIMAPGHLETDNRMLDVLEIPGKGRCHVYIARFSYDPFQQSPNENPEAELSLNAGDYVLVWGNMDEVAPPTIDGFFDGELLDGRKGLVPSNFVEKLVGDDLIEFHQSIVMGLRDCDESVSTSVPQDLDFISQDEKEMFLEYSLNQQGSCPYSSYLDLEDIIEEDEEPMGEHDLFFSVLVPPPVQLTLERQLNKSILIGWNPPSDTPVGTIESYHVYVNGILKTTVKANERTRALVEGVDSTKLHRISVRAVTPHRRTSRDAACTMVIGKDAPVCPTSVRATNITSTSAIISWMPSNSNYQHTVCVNSVEVRTVKPGVYRHTITGLSPNTIYRVTIRAKNLIRAPQFDEKSNQNQVRVSSCVEFRTLPKGLPDPPVDVQVELGPQDGTLLVTWLPVTLNDMGGTSNGAPVTGYAVYADGKKVIEVDSPTGDHALIDLTKIHGFEPKQITVRTKSREAISADSVPTPIPTHFQRGKGRGKCTEEERYQSDYERPSELSDIAEESETEFVEEEDLHQEYNKPDHTPFHRPGQHHPPHQQQHHQQQLHHQPQHHQPQHHQPQHHQPQQPQQTSGGGLLAGTLGLKDKLLGRKVPPPPPPAKTDNLGQTILDPDDLSDKEIYPSQPPHPHPRGPPHPHQPHHLPHPAPIPSIGRGGATRGARQITKDPAGGDSHLDYPEDEYDTRGRYDPRGQHPRSHMDRGRPHPSHMHRGMPRDARDHRGDYRDPHGPRDPRDFRDPRDIPYSRDPRDHRDMRDRRDTREYRDPRDRDYRDTMDPRDPRDRYDDRHRSGDYQRDRMRADHPRIFVALFDYDPPTMSPNPDACEEELGFREGQLIKVFGEKDPDGFYWGEAGGRAGYVPCNMVSEVQVDDDKVAQELLRESESGRRRREGSLGRRAHAGDRWGDIYANTPVRKMVAIYDYDPQELSPNVDSEVELSFQTGDIIYVYGDMDDDGFYMGELRGQRGLVPSNFLQEAPSDYDEHRSRRDTLDPRDRPHPSHARGHGPGAHGPPPPPRPDQRDKRKGYEGGPNGKPPRTAPRPRGQQQHRPGEKW